MSDPLQLAFVGAGNIAGQYLPTFSGVEELRVVSVYDKDTQKAKALAEELGLPVAGSYGEILGDPEIDAVVNLTIHHAHYEVTRMALEAGKHVYSEKPLAMTAEEGRALVELAEAKGLRLACAPITFLGEAQQTAAAKIRAGGLGEVRVVYAEMNHGRIETWHPSPAPFYAVGPVLDIGPYPLTLVTSILGPAVSVQAFGRVVKPERLTRDGEPFTISKPNFVVAVIELASGAVLRLTVNFYVGKPSNQGHAVEFHGDDGALRVASSFNFSADTHFGAWGNQEYDHLELVRPGYAGVEWCRGLVDLARAIKEGRPHRADGRLALHVLEIMCAIDASVAAGGGTRPITSTFDPPELLFA